MEAPVAVVTGGGKRLGRVIALALAGAGYDLFLTYRESGEGANQTAGEARALGRRAHAFGVDLAAPGEPAAAARAALGLFGRVDVLVNNAAIFLENDADSVERADWDASFSLNLLAPLLMTRELAPALRERKGAVVNIGSVGGRRVYDGHLAYSLTKAALDHLTRALARRYAPEIRVNGIAPGTVRLGGEDDSPIGPLARIPLGRYAAPEEFTELLVFLARDAAYVTGQTIAIDGGQSIV